MEEEENLFREPTVEDLNLNLEPSKEEKLDDTYEDNRLNIPSIDLSDLPFIKKEEEKPTENTVTINEEKTMIQEENKEESIKINEPINESQEDKINKLSEDTIINSVNDASDEYATYHIHMVSDGESVETICTMYNSSLNILSEYNDLSNLTPGDKLVIPDKDE